MEMTPHTSLRSWFAAGALLYGIAWTLAAIGYFGLHNFDVLNLLALATIPASLLVSALTRIAMGLLGFEMNTRMLAEMIGFLIFGCIQYGLIGYLIGTIGRKIREVRRSNQG